MTDQDNRASIPQWYRNWIVNIHGAKVMERLDILGEKHDRDIASAGYKIANKLFYYNMKMAELPFWSVRIPVRVAVSIYTAVPQSLKDLYFKLINI